MVPVPRYLYPGRQESPTKSGFPAEGTSASPDVSQKHGHRSRLSTTNPDTCIAIIGVGFIGESLLRQFSRVFPCIGYDICPKRIAYLQDTIKDAAQPIELTTNEAALDHATHFLISVPTLLRSDRSINLDYIHAAIRTVLTHGRIGSTIVLESSVSVGTTRRLLSAHSDLYNIGMSPERVDPGRIEPPAHAIPKLISGLTPAALKTIHAVYSRAFSTVIPVSSPECAELTKLYENSFRMVNIAYANEMADFARRHGVDPTEMVEAAATKPYGFMKFASGLGVGGHCIPVNPYYLFETAGKGHLPVLERATKNMWNRPRRLARQFHRRACFAESTVPSKRFSVGSTGLPSSTPAGGAVPIKQPRILVVGVGFKPGQSVLSCSPSVSFAEQMRELGCARLAFYDPLVDGKEVPWLEKLSVEQWSASYLAREFDAVAICARQDGVDFEVLNELSQMHGKSKGKGVFVRTYVA